jgi:hypothetical protein
MIANTTLDIYLSFIYLYLPPYLFVMIAGKRAMLFTPRMVVQP